MTVRMFSRMVEGGKFVDSKVGGTAGAATWAGDEAAGAAGGAGAMMGEGVGACSACARR
jgi:hypothetical protein